MIEQKMIELCGVNIPIIIEDGIEYYPISYLSDKVLLRKGSILQTNKNTEKYLCYIKKFWIDMSFINAGKQECRCVNLKGLREVVLNLRSGGLSKEQKRRINLLNKFLKVNKEILVKERFCDQPKPNIIDKYSVFIRDAIKDILLDDPDITWQFCNKCSAAYPFHENFFKENQSSPYLLDTYCRECNGWDANRSKTHIRTKNDYLNRIYNGYGEDYYLFCRDHKTIEIYNYYIKKEIPMYPKIISNKIDHEIVLKYLFENKILTVNNLTYEEIKIVNRINNIKDNYEMGKIYELLISEDYYLYPWRYENFRYGSATIKLSFDIATKVFKNYLIEYKIKINDVFKYDYSKIIKKCGVAEIINKDKLLFLVKFNENKYAGYLFNVHGVNYYKDKNNRIFDLKYFIEKDMKLEIEKIPLYLTMTSIINKSRTIYNVLKKYYGNLYEWVNEVYPNRFDERDFVIGFVRNDFDSMQENQIHNILSDNLENVIYNQRNKETTITIGGYNPDWIVITDHGCWLVEYFGLYNERSYDNTRVKYYMNKVSDKIKKYESVTYYNKLYIYPDDLKDNNKGLIDKIKEIK